MNTGRAAPFVEAAHAYASLGWALVRCDGKDPEVHGKGWQQTKPEQPELVAGKWSHWGQRWNLGVVCGPSGVAVLDVDRDDDPDGACLALLGVEDLPETPIVRTGRGRLQLYYRDPGGLAKRARDGFELRVGSHQCVAPPSVHPDTGRPYEWLPGRAPWDVELAELPGHLVAYFAASTNGKSPAPAVGDTIPAGARNASLASIAGTERRRGLGEAEILAALLVTNEQRCMPPLDAGEVERIAQSVGRYDPAPPTAVNEDEGAPSSGYGAVLVDLRSVAVRDVEWHDEGFLPVGQLAIVQGHGGVSKGTLACAWAAQLTHAGKFVLLLAAEDDYATMLKPRLIAAGADLKFLRCVDFRRAKEEDALRIPDDITELRRVIAETSAALVVIDPLLTHLAGAVDAYRDHEVKRALRPLSRLANDTGCTILGVHHFTKDTSRGARHSGQASAAFANTARLVLAMAVDPDTDLRVLEVVKSNIGPEGLRRAVRIELVPVPGLERPVPRTIFAGGSEKTVDELLAMTRTPQRVSKERVQDVIRRLLATGEKTREQVNEAVQGELGVSSDMVYKAGLAPLREAKEIRARKDGFNGGWYWQLTNLERPGSESAENTKFLVQREFHLRSLSQKQSQSSTRSIFEDGIPSTGLDDPFDEADEARWAALLEEAES